MVIDVSRHMRPHLDDALEAVRMLVNAKILFHKQDVVGLVLHGTQATENTLASVGERRSRPRKFHRECGIVTSLISLKPTLKLATPRGPWGWLGHAKVVDPTVITNLFYETKTRRRVYRMDHVTKPPKHHSKRHWFDCQCSSSRAIFRSASASYCPLYTEVLKGAFALSKNRARP